MINYEPNLCNFVGDLDDDITLNAQDGAKSGKFKLNIVRYFMLADGKQGREKAIAEFEIWGSAADFLSKNAAKGDTIWISASYKTAGIFRVNRFKILLKRQVSA
jgi:hypothetical protein